MLLLPLGEQLIPILSELIKTVMPIIEEVLPLFVEMVRGADLVLFNRCTDIKPLAGYRRSVKVVSPQAAIVFEDEEGEIDNIFENVS